MRYLRVATVCSILLVLPLHSESARILGLFALSGKSHNHIFSALTRALAERGHELTVLSPFPLKKDIKNYREISPSYVKELDKNMTNFKNPFEAKKMSILGMLDMLTTMSSNICENGLADEEVQKLIHSDERFDLVIVSVFLNECFYGFAHKLKVPLVLISPGNIFPWVNNALGNPDMYSYSPNAFLTYSDRMTFVERTINTLLNIGILVGRSLYHIPRVEKIAREHFGEDMPSLVDIERNTSLVLLNSHFSITNPRPYLPNIIEIGGIHLKEPKALPKDLQKFIDEAKDGVIYFSMGSGLRGDQIPEDKRQIFIDIFNELPQRVIWKFESELPNKPKNVKIGAWFPQTDILAHPNVRLFITHGGGLSTTEAVYRGVPLVGLPVFGDQNINIHRVSRLGIAVPLDIRTMTKEELLKAIKEVLNNPSYRENVQKLSARFRDQPETPLERAVFWTEYVIRHNGATHLRSAAKELCWFQYFLLDVIAVLGLAVFTVLGIVFLILRTLYRLVRGNKSGTSTKSKKKESKSKKKESKSKKE